MGVKGDRVWKNGTGKSLKKKFLLQAFLALGWEDKRELYSSSSPSFQMRFELRSVGFQGKTSITWATPPALFALVIFEIASHVYAQASLDHDPPIYAMRGPYHHAQPSFLFLEM
jgi:hypothetical protein